MDKISFSEASGLAGVHFNTLRNWRKAGKLKTAEKIIENGREMWIVDPEEVEQLTRQSRQDYHDNTPVDIGPINVDNPPREQHNQNPQASANPPTPGGAAPTLALEQSLIFMRESVVKPLVEANERQALRLEQMAEEIGSLKQRIKQLEEAQPSPGPDVTQTQNPPQPVDLPAPTPPPTRKSLLARLFGIGD